MKADFEIQSKKNQLILYICQLRKFLKSNSFLSL